MTCGRCRSTASCCSRTEERRGNGGSGALRGRGGNGDPWRIFQEGLSIARCIGWPDTNPALMLPGHESTMAESRAVTRTSGGRPDAKSASDQRSDKPPRHIPGREVAARAGSHNPAIGRSALFNRDGRRAGINRSPATLDHTTPSSDGIAISGRVRDLSHSVEEARNRVANNPPSSLIVARLRWVARRTSRPATRVFAGLTLRTAETLSASPRIAAPPAAMRSTTSTTAISCPPFLLSNTSIDLDLLAVGSIATSRRAAQLPGRETATIRSCRRRCSISRGRSAPGRASMNAASWTPTAAAHDASVSMEADVTSPRSRRLQNGWETPARAAAWACVRLDASRDSRSPSQMRRAIADALRRPSRRMAPALRRRRSGTAR